jgi:hypothetical protein
MLMRDGWLKQRAYDFEHTRMISYHIAAANRDPKKRFPEMTEWWPLLTDEKIDKKEQAELDRQKRAELIAAINAKFNKNLTA